MFVRFCMAPALGMAFGNRVRPDIECDGSFDGYIIDCTQYRIPYVYNQRRICFKTMENVNLIRIGRANLTRVSGITS